MASPRIGLGDSQDCSKLASWSTLEAPDAGTRLFFALRKRSGVCCMLFGKPKWKFRLAQKHRRCEVENRSVRSRSIEERPHITELITSQYLCFCSKLKQSAGARRWIESSAHSSWRLGFSRRRRQWPGPRPGKHFAAQPRPAIVLTPLGCTLPVGREAADGTSPSTPIPKPRGNLSCEAQPFDGGISRVNL